MQPRLTRRKGAALLATAGLVAGGLTAFGATGAGAVGPATPTPPDPGSTSTSFTECPATTQIGPVTLVNIGTIAGQSQDSELYPSGASVRWDGGLTMTVTPQAVATAKATATQFGLQLLAIGVQVSSVEVLATNTVEGGFTHTVASPTVQTIPVDATVEANGAQFTLPQAISGTLTTSGADGDTVDFKAGKVVASNVTVLSGVGQQITAPDSAATCAVNENAPYAPAAPSAQVALVATSPSVPAQGTTVSSASATSTFQVAPALATPQASLAAGGASSGTPAAIVDYAISPLAATGGAAINPTTGLITYTPPNNQFAGPETFTVTVTDALGAQGSGTVTLDVVAGDATSADVEVTINGAVGSQLFIPQCGPNTATKSAPCPTITMSAINLNGKKQTSTGQIGQITVVDARGLPLPWTLSATLDGNLVNQNPPSGSLVTDGNNIIPADQLTMQGQTCVVDVANGGGGDFSATTTGSAGTLDGTVIVCQAAIGQSGGTFLANANLSLNVNPDLYVGTYAGTINFLLA